MELGEFDLIETYFAPLASGVTGAFNLKDDAAVIEPPAGKSVVITNDTIVEGIHFFSEDSAEQIASKLLRVNLSDLAAMGSVPAFYNLSIALNSSISAHWVKKFARGLQRDQSEFGVSLLGGDTVSTSGPLTFSLTAIGYIESGKFLRRSGAVIDDDIWVSGTIGDAALGLLGVQGKLDNFSPNNLEYLISRYKKPNPRVQLAPALIDSANAVIDVSDGLLSDLNHICSESRVGADIFVSQIPVSDPVNIAINQDPNLVDLILSGGDDFELLFTAKISKRALFESTTKALKIPLTRIGSIVKNRSISVYDENGTIIPKKKLGYTHF